jgi:hypothetical protein
MRISGRFVFPLFVIAVILGFANPARTLAGGTNNAIASPQPKPDQEKKVWTNDDFAPAAPQSVKATVAEPAQTTGVLPIISQQHVPAPLENRMPSAPINPEQDPRWYSQQAISFESELANIETKEQKLRGFRATGKGLPTGLNIYAPCEGITTDHFIAQLDARRQDIVQQMDSLEDTARHNDLPPGILVEGRGRVQIENEMTPDQQRVEIGAVLSQRSRELAETQDTIAAMQKEAVAKGFSLQLPALGNASNQTSSLLDQLDSRANALQSEVRNAEDDARHAGIEPGSLR